MLLPIKVKRFLKIWRELYLLGFLLELLDCSLVDSSTFVNQMAGGGGFPGIHVANDDDVDMSFFSRHFRFLQHNKL